MKGLNDNKVASKDKEKPVNNTSKSGSTPTKKSKPTGGGGANGLPIRGKK